MFLQISILHDFITKLIKVTKYEENYESFQHCTTKRKNIIIQKCGMKGLSHKGTSARVKMGGARCVTLITGTNVYLFCKIICFIL